MNSAPRRRTDDEFDTGWRLKKEFSAGDAIAILVAAMSILSMYFKLDTRISLVENDSISRREAVQKIERRFEIIDMKLDRVIERLPPTPSDQRTR